MKISKTNQDPSDLNRRDFLKGGSLTTLTMLMGEGALKAEDKPRPAERQTQQSRRGNQTLFPTDLPGRQWVEFSAQGYSQPAFGVVYRGGQVHFGVPLGGVGTGWVDLNSDGTLGRFSIFNTHRFPKPNGIEPPGFPFLGFAIGEKTWVLTLQGIEGVRNAKNVHYWGHHPIADLEYETDAPVSVGLRAWSPFLPGDSAGSNTPAAVFHVFLRNQTDQHQQGRLAFSFPGPRGELHEWRRDSSTADEKIVRKRLEGEIGGVMVTKGVTAPQQAGYVLGVLNGNGAKIQVGDSLKGPAWANLAGTLPGAKEDAPGATVAVDFELSPGQEQVVTYLLAWYDPSVWAGGDRLHIYSSRFGNVLEVARHIAKHRQIVLKRVIAWQEVIYAEKRLPAWLREVLVNAFHAVTRNSLWIRDPSPDRDGSNGAFFIHAADEQGWAWCECQADLAMGHFPALFFFPELERTTLGAIKHHQLESGETPFVLRAVQGLDLRKDSPKPQYGMMHPVNWAYYIHRVYRYYQRTGDIEFLKVQYPSVRKALEFGKRFDQDGDKLIESEPTPGGPAGWYANHGYEFWPWYGANAHSSGLCLAAFKHVEAMAREAGDTSLEKECRVWVQEGLKSYNEKLWTGQYYRLYNDTVKGRRSDTVLANQLMGQWASRVAGQGDLFEPEKVAKVSATLKRLNFAVTEFGMLNALRPDGTEDKTGSHSALSTGIIPSEILMAACTMLYAGERQMGLEVARQIMSGLVLFNLDPWSWPSQFNNAKGQRGWGISYDTIMVVWAVPAAVFDQDVHSFCAPGGLVDQVVKAASAD